MDGKKQEMWLRACQEAGEKHGGRQLRAWESRNCIQCIHSTKPHRTSVPGHMSAVGGQWRTAYSQLFSSESDHGSAYNY